MLIAPNYLCQITICLWRFHQLQLRPPLPQSTTISNHHNITDNRSRWLANEAIRVALHMFWEQPIKWRGRKIAQQ